jgi:hypothetical protein
MKSLRIALLTLGLVCLTSSAYGRRPAPSYRNLYLGMTMTEVEKHRKLNCLSPMELGVFCRLSLAPKERAARAWFIAGRLAQLDIDLIHAYRKSHMQFIAPVIRQLGLPDGSDSFPIPTGPNVGLYMTTTIWTGLGGESMLQIVSTKRRPHGTPSYDFSVMMLRDGRRVFQLALEYEKAGVVP